MKLTNDTAISLLASLIALDGYERVVKGPSGDQIVKELYKFGGKVRLDIAKNINMLQPVVKVFSAAKNSVINELTDGIGVIDHKSNPELAVRLFAEENKLLADEVDIPLIRIKIFDLNLDVNDIPASRLAFLAPILEDSA